MHICWRSLTQNGYSSWQRIKFEDGTDLSISLSDITTDRRLLPRITSFSHPFLSAVLPEEEIWFQVTTDGIPMQY